MWWLIGTGSFVLLFLAVFVWMIIPRKRRELPGLLGKDYAHRGLWNKERPENSLAAFQAAVDKGYGMELDVHLTADGHLVVHHDDNLKRMTGVDRVIGSSTLEEVRQCKLPNGEPVPTFDEMLALVDGKEPLIVELKVEGNSAALAEAVYQRMKRYNGPWCMESFSPVPVKWFRDNAPEVIRGQLAFNRAFRKAPWKVFVRDLGIATMTQNAWSRPDFVAFEAKSEKRWCLSMLLLRWMNPWWVAWTVHSQQEMDALRGRYDLQIFEGFEPPKD